MPRTSTCRFTATPSLSAASARKRRRKRERRSTASNVAAAALLARSHCPAKSTKTSIKEPAMRDFEEYRASVGHLMAQHQRLHALLARARAAVRQMNGPDGDATLQHIAHILELVRTELALHFT